MTTLHLGIDGGGTGCRARLVTSEGVTLAESDVGAAANTTLGLDVVIPRLVDIAQRCLDDASESVDISELFVVAGLAGLTLASERTALAKCRHPFGRLVGVPDVVTACLGAHDGSDGGVVVIGTGSAACLVHEGQVRTAGGWGFLVSDHGSGARLGRAAVEYALLASEGIEPDGTLAANVRERFDGSLEAIVRWVLAATPGDFGALAPVVLSHAHEGDAEARALVMRAAEGPARLVRALVARGAARVVLMGGMAEPLRPWLSPDVTRHLVPPRGDALDGAILLAQRLAAGGTIPELPDHISKPSTLSTS